MARNSPILRHFEYSHLGNMEAQEVSEYFYDLAWQIETVLDTGPEKSVALRKLLEAKDAAVRAVIEMVDEADDVD